MSQTLCYSWVTKLIPALKELSNYRQDMHIEIVMPSKAFHSTAILLMV